MGHTHHHRATGSVLLISLVLTAMFVAVEAIAGFRAGSLALLSDAGHNFADAFALALAAVGFYLQFRPGDHIKTYGYQRAGVLVAFINALMLVVLAAVLFYESYRRLLAPVPVAASIMTVVAAAGLALNGAIAWALSGPHRRDLNMRAAWIHMLGDAASSAAIIAGAVVIRYTGWNGIDPALSILIGAAMVWSAWGIMRDSLNILLEGTPKGLKLSAVSGELLHVPGVIDVHDLHIWSLGSEAHALSCHVLIEDVPPSASESILKEINAVLAGRFAIHHTTIQFENAKCALADVSCTVARPHSH